MVGQCCVAGEIHMGTPAGRVDKVHDIDCYIAEPASGNPKGIVVILTDIFGWTLVNTRILADEYAKKGEFRVYVPDFFGGHGLPASYLTSLHAVETAGFFMKIYYILTFLPYIIPFLWYTRMSVGKPRIFGWFHVLRAEEAANLPVGVAGFCWGGKWVALLCHDTEKEGGKSLVDCGFTAHPSMLTLPDDIEKVKKPLSVAAAAIDSQLPKDKADLVRGILEAKAKKGDEEHEFVWYEGAHHGFAVRGSETDPVESQRGLEAEEQAISWFKKWSRA